MLTGSYPDKTMNEYKTETIVGIDLNKLFPNSPVNWNPS
jgi:hypothetical protein